MRRLLVTTVLLAAVGATPAVAAPRVNQLVVFKNGSSRTSHPLLAPATARVGRKNCAVPGGTPLAALIRSGIGPLSIKDYGSCSKRGTDAGSLFVSAIGNDRNRGSDGWVYKAGNRLGTAGAADPSGPFGSGRLRAGARVTWFWCHVTARNNGCPHTLALTAKVAGRTVTVTVRQFDDHARGRAAGGAIVHSGSRTARTGPKGVARLRLGRGRHSIWASQSGRIQSFGVGVRVG